MFVNVENWFNEFHAIHEKWPNDLIPSSILIDLLWEFQFHSAKVENLQHKSIEPMRIIIKISFFTEHIDRLRKASIVKGIQFVVRADLIRFGWSMIVQNIPLNLKMVWTIKSKLPENQTLPPVGENCKCHSTFFRVNSRYNRIMWDGKYSIDTNTHTKLF